MISAKDFGPIFPVYIFFLEINLKKAQILSDESFARVHCIENYSTKGWSVLLLVLVRSKWRGVTKG